MAKNAVVATTRLPRPLTWSAPLLSLLRADFIAQLRSFRSLVLTFALPLVLLVVGRSGGKSASRLGGPSFIIGVALTVGLVSICAIGYALAIARDRDRGVLQRLRVTPAPTWTIMGSRWLVHVASVIAMAVVVLIAGAVISDVTLSATTYVFTVIATVVGSAVFLSIGQAIAGLIRSADTLNATGRLIYIPLIGLSLFGHSSVLGTTFELVSRWSPGGSLEDVLAAAMGANAWSGETWAALFACAGYTVVFTAIGIRWFRWSGR